MADIVDQLKQRLQKVNELINVFEKAAGVAGIPKPRFGRKPVSDQTRIKTSVRTAKYWVLRRERQRVLKAAA